MRAVQGAPTRPVATRMKRRLYRLAKQEHEPSARAARSLLAGDPHDLLSAFVSRPYLRHRRVRLSIPARIGWYYVLQAAGLSEAAICVGHAKLHRHAPMSVQSAAFARNLLDSVHTVAELRGLGRRSHSLAVIHVPELMLLLLWVRQGSRSRYRIVEPSHPDAPRGVLLAPSALDRLVTKIYRRLSNQARLSELIRVDQPDQP